jgi:hypothetical protein
MRIPSRAAFFAAALVVAPLVLSSPWLGAAEPAPYAALAQDPFAAAKAKYEEYLRRLPLVMHTRGRTHLAQTRDPRALDILAASYAKPSEPREQVRYLIAGICGRAFNSDVFVDRWIQWRNESTTPGDAYLWYRSLFVEGRTRGPEGLVAIATDPEQHILMRAAAVRALADARSPVVTDLIAGLCLELPKAEEEKHALVASIGQALLAQKSALGDDAYQRAASAYAVLLDEEHKLAPITKLVIARYLGQSLGIDQLYLESGLWLTKIKAKGAVADGPRPSSDTGGTVTKPKFFGLEASGTNIVYVIDMSDSMCKPIDHNLKPKSGPTTGGGSAKKKRKKGEVPTVDDIPWERVNNRFDLAREHLKISLMGLEKDKSFAVVFFGDVAGLMDSCSGMMEATPQNIQKVVKELDAITPGPPIAERPDGVLRGKTNMHGGLRRAFQVRARGLADKEEYIDAKATIEGADTIFLLSDGDPTWDDWDCHDKNYGEDPIGDPESGIAQPDAPNLHYFGPYVDRTHLVDDVTRMNLFRAVEIHCVAIGEVDVTLLQEISRIGLNGKTHVVK